MKCARLPIVLIIIGCLWLFAELGFFRATNFIWPIILCVLGLFVFIGSGFHKGSFVLGGVLWVEALLSTCRILGLLSLSLSLPVLLISLGFLMLINASPLIPKKA